MRSLFTMTLVSISLAAASGCATGAQAPGARAEISQGGEQATLQAQSGLPIPKRVDMHILEAFAATRAPTPVVVTSLGEPSAEVLAASDLPKCQNCSALKCVSAR